MEQLLFSKRKFSFSGICMEMAYATKRCSFVGEDIWNAYEEKLDVPSDFSFYVYAELPPTQYREQDVYVRYEDPVIIMNYSDEESYLVLTADISTGELHLYHKNDNDANGWFDKLGNMFSWMCLLKESCCMHAVILEVQGKGILLTAPSGTGKSTHAHYWRDVENGLIINGDKALLRRIDGKWWACGSPWRGTSGECINRKAPLSAIVVLKQASENHTKKLSPLEGFQAIVSRMMAPREVYLLTEKCIDFAGDLVENIPIYELGCTNHPDSVACLKETLVADGILR